MIGTPEDLIERPDVAGGGGYAFPLREIGTARNVVNGEGAGEGEALEIEGQDFEDSGPHRIRQPWLA
jgi:hypothetical protein